MEVSQIGTAYAVAEPSLAGTWVELAPAVAGSMLALVTEPWGQRRFQVSGPGGLAIELVQPVEPDPEWLAAQGLAG